MQAVPACAYSEDKLDNTSLDFTNSFSIYLGNNGNDGANFQSEATYLYYTPVNQTIELANSKYGTLEAGQLYVLIAVKSDESEYKSYRKLGDAKSILGSSSSTGLSEEQKTIIKDLIANWPGLCRLVEKFNERNDDNDEYDKKT